MATIREITKKFSTTILDTDLSIIFKKLIKWVVLPVLCLFVLIFLMGKYNDYKRSSYCESQGVSEYYCDAFIRSGGD
ncbi:hypothetical protein UB37_19805 [Photobacterium iliopiscarium]|uniref:Uncharacterized protein n=1 Tax=Photobacterium iliopiscarium TaxID=56192 RepID=A0ABX5GMJ8_9GAMM|nr:hypothetical protein [Photobacterium iliopiscarium]KJG17205.1 hypothetical protein UB37_19805 [Photobacterium iliopiscarium]PSW92306.1 hypothetical protein C9J52_18965 [Photobacterium iliopiscarium]